jgi:hypothetical protein
MKLKSSWNLPDIAKQSFDNYVTTALIRIPIL